MTESTTCTVTTNHYDQLYAHITIQFKISTSIPQMPRMAEEKQCREVEEMRVRLGSGKERDKVHMLEQSLKKMCLVRAKMSKVTQIHM